MTNKPAEPSPEVAPMQRNIGRCSFCHEVKPIVLILEDGELRCSKCVDAPVPAVAPRETQPEPKIPDDLLVDWKTLNEPYVHPMTLEWAIQRDRNMQDFARKLILRIARLEGGR